MKIAVPVTPDNQVDDHFGHCEFYQIFTISDDKQISSVQILPSTQGCGCKSNIATTLASQGVSVMLAGGIGAGAIQVLNHAGIDVIRGCSGNPRYLVEQFIAGKIRDSGSSCAHHEHHHHECSHEH